jgi:alkylation response protein AidB-like acyl-CoA dehydrogenase
MDFEDSAEDAAYRAKARKWLAAHAPSYTIDEGTMSEADIVARGRAWQKELFDAGYAGITLPRELGGQGGTSQQAALFAAEEGHYHLPNGAYIGIGKGMAIPVILKHGTPQQIERFVGPTLRGDITWCQLFSEPGAGSDLAGLRTKAVQDGSIWIANGQKVWSSWAHHADWGILVVRTDPNVPKHKGLTYFVVDMRTPGIEVRPIRQISGASDFNETFLTDVHIPDTDRIGAIGDGWAATMTTLMGERLSVGTEDHHGIGALIRYAATTPRGDGSALDSQSVRLALANAYAEELASRYFHARLSTMVSRGENPGALASIIKLVYTGRFQKMSGLAMEIRGPDAIAPDPEDAETARIQGDYIWSAAMRIAGGADEVLRNQLAERVLGMPGEIRSDKNIPFNKL